MKHERKQAPKIWYSRVEAMKQMYIVLGTRENPEMSFSLHNTMHPIKIKKPSVVG